MNTGISALQHVKQTLKASDEFNRIADGRIYPVAHRMGTTRPYVVATRTATVSEYTKDGWEKDSVTVSMEVVTDTYETAVELAEVVREHLEGHAARYDGWEVRDCSLSRSSDGYAPDADAYVITLEFIFEIY